MASLIQTWFSKVTSKKKKAAITEGGLVFSLFFQVIELAKLPYSEDTLLNALDAQEVPAFLVDLLESSLPALFYSGCVVAEVHDLRAQARASQATQGDVTHLLLRPTTQSIICDSNVMAKQLSAVHGRPLTQARTPHLNLAGLFR